MKLPPWVSGAYLEGGVLAETLVVAGVELRLDDALVPVARIRHDQSWSREALN